MTTETCAGNIGIYLRISDDRDGTQTATKRQLADCQRFATSKGWHVADVFEDVDTSAYQRTSKRPEFERMLASVRDGAIDGVLAWKMDRLSRRQRDLVRLDEQCEDSGGFIATVSEQIDTRQPSGRFVAELLVSQARMESSNTSIRVTRAHEQMAKNGQPVLGGMRPFGYSKDRSEIIPQEAELIRDAARRVMAGESVRSVCRDWQAQGVVSSAGKPWKTASLSRLLGSAFISGQRDYQGAMTPGKWPAIITPAETATLRGILADPGRRKIGGWARTYLLTGLIRCGLCHEPLIAKPTATHVRRYVCAKVPGMVSCGRLARAAQPVEDMITEAVFQALDGADIAAYVRRTDREADEVTWQAVAADEAALEELARDFYTDKAISRAEFFAARGALQGRLEQNRKSLARASRNEVLSTVIGRGALDLRKLWAERPLDWKRAVISAVIDHVVLDPAVKGRNAFDPSLVRLVWRA